MTDVTITTTHTVKIPNPPLPPETNTYGVAKEQIITLTPETAKALYAELQKIVAG